MNLVRSGGAGDKGIDLKGWWKLPSRESSSAQAENVRVLVQCKAEAKKLGPRTLRELEGSMHRS
ncbi:hypothetical protein K437DRAFT_218340, partial [Tilletiaria anomala UBC 951]